MTALCGGGASRVRSGVPDNVTLTGAGLAGLAELLAIPGLGEVLAFAVAGTSFAAPVYCANDPPADPVLTPTDVANALLVTQPSISLPAIQRIVQWVLHTYWWDICECVAVPTPTRPAPSNPGGTGTDPSLPRTSTAHCFAWSGSLGFPASLGTDDIIDFTARVLPPVGIPIPVTPPGTIGTLHASPIPPGLKSITSTTALDTNDPTSSGAFLLVGYWDAARNSLRQDTLGQGSTHTPITLTNFAAPAGAAYWAFYGQQAASGGVQSDWSMQLTADCGGPGFTSDCCPPDPSLDIRLRQIIELLQQLLNAPASNPAYVLGPVHPNISGSASISIPSNPGGQGLRGMKVQLIAGVPSHLVLPGVPPYQWDMGWMSFLTGDGMIEERRITRQNQVWLAPAFPLATTFGYFLNPGVVATFTELLPAP